MAGAIKGAEDGFARRLAERRFPQPLTNLSAGDFGLTRPEMVELFESQLLSRRLDLEARRLGAEKRGYYSIGSSGHEGNAALARTLRLTDMAFLHYRSGAFLIERSRQAPGSTPIWDMALSFVASSEDPISGGRHKVLGSKRLFIPPQTSTIASHLPKALGAAYSIALSRTVETPDRAMPKDAVVLCSFGDASANHSTAQGAFNTAGWTAYQNLPLPLIFLCEDNGMGISVTTPEGWTRTANAARPGLTYIACDGRDIVDALRGAREAERCARARRKPVFLHMRTVRLMGHAGSDIEDAYRDRSTIEREADHDPLLHAARRLIDEFGFSADEIGALYQRTTDRVHAVMEKATTRPKLSSSDAVTSALLPPKHVAPRNEESAPATDATPLHLSRMISATLAEEMARFPQIVVFGEDVGKKGGVYGATVKLQKTYGPHRVFDTLLDEQSILGMAIGLAHNGFAPIPEIQFLAYVHNAEDQIRGEAASLAFFSKGQFANPMVIRIAGLAYQKGFGGHFHNDNSIAVFRDIPGVILACPSNAADGARLLRECIRLAIEERRVVVFLEPIALYGTKDLHTENDGEMLSPLPSPGDRAGFLEPALHGDGADIAIVTYGNGTYMARRAARRLAAEGVSSRVVDLRWLSPLPMDRVLELIAPAKTVLIVDECRRTGSLAEELFTRLKEAGVPKPIRRLNGEDTFIPLGPAANEVLISEELIERTALELALVVGRPS